ncbi:MAG: PAS domain-containing protein, partial [Mycobacteriales bacterium]
MTHPEQPAQGPHRIVLDGFPIRLFDAAEEQWEALLREYALRSLGGIQQSFNADEVNQGRDAITLVAEGAARSDRSSGPTTLVLWVSQPSDFGVLQAVLHDARRLSIAGELLMVPTLPELAALRNWLCEEIPAQAAGGAPTPWVSGGIVEDPDGPPPVEWDDHFLPPPDVSWVVGDDHNRIVAASPAAEQLLGWADDLVGQRLLSMIPPQLREAH